MPRNMLPSLGEHVLILGENGEGKSTLASGLLNEFSQTHPIVVFDTKGEELFDPWVDTHDWNEVRQRLEMGRPRTVYRPIGPDLDQEALDDKLRELYDSGWTGAVYIDELEHFVPGTVALPGMRYVLLSGRRRKIPGPDGERRICKLGLWMSAHRPVWIPRYCKNEPKSYFVFGIADDDLKDMRPYLHNTPMSRPMRYNYWWYRKGDMEQARLMPPVQVR